MNYRIPDRVGHVLEDSDDGPVLYLCPLPLGPATVLSGSGAIICLSAISGDEDIHISVAEAFGLDVESIRADVDGFLSELTGRGLLEEVS